MGERRTNNRYAPHMRTERVTVSLPAELVDEARNAVRRGAARSISAYVAREPVFRKAYDSLNDALLQSTSTTYYGFGE